MKSNFKFKKEPVDFKCDEFKEIDDDDDDDDDAADDDDDDDDDDADNDDEEEWEVCISESDLESMYLLQLLSG